MPWGSLPWLYIGIVLISGCFLLLLLAVLLYCLSPPCIVPGSILITTLVMCLGLQGVAAVSVLLRTGQVEFQCELELNGL